MQSGSRRFFALLGIILVVAFGVRAAYVLGEASGFVGDGSTIAIGGSLPLNPHGGQLSAGRLHGFGFLHEAVVQLRRDAGERQVVDAEVAVVTTGGGTPGGCFLLTR